MAAATAVRHAPEVLFTNIYDNEKARTNVQSVELGLPSNTVPSSQQQQPQPQQVINVDEADLLISSPYTEVEHRLRLSTLDVQSSLMAQALQHLAALSPDYATSPYADGLNWEAVLTKLRDLSQEHSHSWASQTFYVVAFFSRLKADIDREHLGKLDKDSHAEAAASGGLLKYWFGSPNSDRRNLATCVWRSHEDAIAGGKGPGHANAMRATRSLYEQIDFKTMSLTIDDGARTLRFDSLGEKAFDYST